MAPPLHIISGPLDVYWAAVGEAFTVIDVAVAGTWAKIGTSGDDDYSEDGVILAPAQTLEPFRTLGSTGPRKIFRTEEDLIVRVMIHDMTLEFMRLAFDQNTVTTDAGPPAIKHMGLYRGPGEADQIALQIRGVNKSPYFATGPLQLEIPVCSHIGSWEMAFQKSPPAGVLMEFQCIEDPSAASDDLKFGRLVAQTA